jgi:hypothetical protein
VIYKVEDYYSNGKHIREYIIVSGETPGDFSRFVGIGGVDVDLNGFNISRQFKFHLEADSIEEAFEKFDEEYALEKPKALERENQHIKDLSKKHSLC